MSKNKPKYIPLEALKVPQRRPNSSMNGTQLLNKAITGKHILKTEAQRKKEEVDKILNG